MESGTRRKSAPPEPKRRAKEFEKVDPPADVMKISSDEAISRIKGMANGWKDEFSEVLRMPQELFFYNQGNVMVLSKDEGLSIMKLMPALRADADPPKDIRAYGIMIYETAGNAYLVFADSQRRIVVRDRITSFHSGAEEWGRIISVIKGAISLSDTARSPDSMVFVDETRLKKKVL